MSWSAKRQLLILLIILIFFGFFAGLFFFVTKPELSCRDNIMNQKEEGIDCGGPCDRVCPNTVSDPVIKWARILPVRAGQFDAVAYVENPNPGTGLSRLDYIFKLYDAKNNPVTTRRGSTFLGPGEKLALYEPLIDVGTLIPVRAFLELIKPDDGYIWHKVIKDSRVPNLTVRTKQFDNASNSRITATIANDSLNDGYNIKIVAVLFDQDDNAIGASSTYVDVIKGASELPVVFTWPNSFPIAPVSFEIYIHHDKESVAQ